MGELARTEALHGARLCPVPREPNTSGCEGGQTRFPFETRLGLCLGGGSLGGCWSRRVSAGLCRSPFLLPEEGYDLPLLPSSHPWGIAGPALCFSTAFRWCHCSARQSGDVTFCHSSKPWISDHMHCFLGCHSSYRGTKRRLYRKRIDFASFTSKECCIVAATSLLLAPNQYLCI